MSNHHLRKRNPESLEWFILYVATGFAALVASHWLAEEMLKVWRTTRFGPDEQHEWILATGSLILFIVAFWGFQHRHHSVRRLDFSQAFLGLVVLLGGQWFARSGERCFDHWLEHELHLPKIEIWMAVGSLAVYLGTALVHLKLRPRFQRLSDRVKNEQRVIAE